MKKRWWFLIIIVLIFLFLLIIPKDKPEGNGEVIIEKIDLGNDILFGITVTETTGIDFNEAFNLAKDVGLDVVGLPLAWDEIETSPKNYGNVFLGIANIYYPSQNTKLFLVVSPIDTNNLRIPSDLQGKDFDDPEVISRFNSMMDYVLEELNAVELVSVSIGNEIDIYLGQNQEEWAQYEEFLKQTSSHIKSKKNIKTGAKATFKGLTKTNINELKNINNNLDVVMVTYYPLNPDFSVQDPSVVSGDINKLISSYNKEIQILEAGYPSSSSLGSSETKQAEFVLELFKISNINKDKIKVINLEWLHDKSSSEVNSFASYYGIPNKNFKEYLGSLGLRTASGKDKKVFASLK
tara:strand:+ start:206 stop:1258 length:1053 start_codon:yes stop_codon:yes gene_type:complete